MNNTPVALFVFNRPDITQQVFNIVRQARPAKLLLISDGPRENRVDDVEKVAQVRKIIENVDWQCEVFKNYATINMGLQKRMSSGITWVFEKVEEAIVLEDDCVPDLTFFPFVQELLERYRNDSRVMVISGTNVQEKNEEPLYSYYFSRHNHCWGWATWSRAWKYYDFDMKLWPEVRDQHLLQSVLTSNEDLKYWENLFQSVYDGDINSWAYRWTFACWIESGLTILPKVNLVANIGFSEGATHTKDEDFHPFSIAKETEPIQFPLKHPPFILRNTFADDTTQSLIRKKPVILKRVIRKIKKYWMVLKNSHRG